MALKKCKNKHIMINNVAFSGSILMNSLLPGAMKKALFPEIPNDDSIDCTTSTKFTSEGPLQPFFLPIQHFPFASSPFLPSLSVRFNSLL